MLIAELRQAVLAEGTRLRARGLVPRTGEETSAAQPVLPTRRRRATDGHASAAQPGSNTKQRRVTAMFSAGDRQRAGAAASSGSETSRAIESNASAAQPGPPTKRQRATDGPASAAQPGSAAASSSSAAALSPMPANEPLQRSLLDYGANPDDLSDLRRAMFQIRLELARLKNQTAANDTAIETLAAFVKQSTQLHQLPATARTLKPPQMTSLFVEH